MITTVTHQRRTNWMIIRIAFDHERLDAELEQAIATRVADQ